MHKYVTFYQSISGYRTMLVVADVPRQVSETVYSNKHVAERAAREWAKRECCTYLSDQTKPFEADRE